MKVIRESQGAGTKCRKFIRAQCARYREIKINIAAKHEKGVDDGQLIAKTVCPNSQFPKACYKDRLRTDWGQVKENDFFIIRHDQYHQELGGTRDESLLRPCDD